jgi:nitrilase
MWSRQHLLSRAFAIQTGAYVLCAAGTLTQDAVPERYRSYLTQRLTGDSVIIDPRGEIVAGPVQGENTVIAECSMALELSPNLGDGRDQAAAI